MSYKCPKLQKCHKLIQKTHQLQVWLFISVQLNSIANFLLKSSKACLAISEQIWQGNFSKLLEKLIRLRFTFFIFIHIRKLAQIGWLSIIYTFYRHVFH